MTSLRHRPSRQCPRAPQPQPLGVVVAPQVLLLPLARAPRTLQRARLSSAPRSCRRRQRWGGGGWSACKPTHAHDAAGIARSYWATWANLEMVNAAA
jgi:hypothetical protein